MTKTDEAIKRMDGLALEIADTVACGKPPKEETLEAYREARERVRTLVREDIKAIAKEFGL